MIEPPRKVLAAFLCGFVCGAGNRFLYSANRPAKMDWPSATGTGQTYDSTWGDHDSRGEHNICYLITAFLCLRDGPPSWSGKGLAWAVSFFWPPRRGSVLAVCGSTSLVAGGCQSSPCLS